MTHEKNFVTAGPVADRTAGSQCQSEVADRKIAHTAGPWGFPCRQCNGELAKATAAHPWSREDMAHSHAHLTADNAALRAQRDELAAALKKIARFGADWNGAECAADARAALARLDGGK